MISIADSRAGKYPVILDYIRFKTAMGGYVAIG
jgi:hypothetical protein